MLSQSAPPDEAMNNQDIYKSVGKQLKHFRLKKRHTQAEIAKYLKVSPQQYQKYEDAQSKCNLNYLVKLAAFYDVALTSLLGGENENSVLLEEEATTDAELLARLVSSFVKLDTYDEKIRLVQLVEAIAD